MKVLIIGFGNMGKTYANSFISSRFIKQDDIFILTRDVSKRTNDIGIPEANITTIPSEKISAFDIIILAIKPQDFKTLATSIASFLNKNQIVLSVMAGVTIPTLKSKLGCEKIVRSMPNMPSQIGKGMTVFTASNQVDRKELFIIQNLINTTGKSIYVENEKLIDAATAISGSGPAYVFYFMNSMIKAAENLGFSQSEAELLVNQTFMGSVDLQNSSSISNEQWIKKVASKGGTTEQALLVFENNKVEDAIVKAVIAANNRAVELGS
ncbi:MAG: pyrroline-5-carboxylate reductase [Flavobacterium sp.]|nr:pyrroline-5-carboxylate reductase [Flavobacterium sp.]